MTKSNKSDKVKSFISTSNTSISSNGNGQKYDNHLNGIHGTNSNGSTINSNTSGGNVAREYQTPWGWGRPNPSPLSSDQLAYAKIPWYMVYFVDIVASLSIVFMIFGLPHSITSFYAYLILFPILLLILALPSFAIIAIPLSYYLSPNSPGNPEQYWIFHDERLERSWSGRKIGILSFYEAYFEGKLSLGIDPTTGKAYDLLKVLYHRDEYIRYIIEWDHVYFFFTKFIPELLTHSRSQDVEQVREHYDRGDDFYSSFLGDTMVYTSAIFHTPNDTLEEAQMNKINLVANKLHIVKGDKHLDLGCGWGTLITHFAKEYDTDSVGVTLGKNQTEWANQKAKNLGVSTKATAYCMDYRDVPAQFKYKFNKISCLEMSEHVGVKYYSSFCSQVYDQLEDDGIFFLQIAGLRRAWQFEDFNWGLFMGKYVFPGADASCPLFWVIDKLESAGFEIHSVETIGIHYSASIKRWYDNWKSNESYILNKYGQRWYRLWLWFLAWSVISPEQGSASCYQIVCHKNLKRFDRKKFVFERKQWKI